MILLHSNFLPYIFSGDLIACDIHFALMEKTGMTFSEALVGNPEVNGFHVAEAISKGDIFLLELRMSQCESCGEEASSIFMALVYFLKQVCFVLKNLEETKNMMKLRRLNIYGQSYIYLI